MTKWGKRWEYFFGEDRRMANKHVERCPTSLEVRERQNYTTTQSVECSPSKPTVPSIGKNAEQPELSHIAGKSLQWYKHFGRFFYS